jgi:hypothetical protein
MGPPRTIEDYILEITREIVEEERCAELHRAKAADLKARLAATLRQMRDAAANEVRDAVAAEDEVQTLGGRVLTLLLSNPRELYDAPAIARALALPQEKLPTLRTVLNRLQNRGMVGNPHRGLYSGDRKGATK